MSNLTLFRELQTVRVELIQERQAKNYLKHQNAILKAQVADLDTQLENATHLFRLAEANRALAEMENERLVALERRQREQIEALEQRERERLEDEHKRTGQIAS